MSAAGLAAVTSAHEGNAQSVYGDIGVAGGSKEIKNKYGDRPEVWSKRVLGTEKKLTDLTFTELLAYQKYRNNVKASTGAVGIAGFMPSTIFGKNLDGKTGLFKQSGLSWDDKFSEKNQKLLKDVLDGESDAILKGGLKKLGIDNITPGIKIAANYVGPTGLLWVIEEGQKNPNITVRDALMKRNGGKDVTKINQKGDESKENTINADLRTTLAVDFVKKKEDFAMKKAKELGVYNSSSEDMKLNKMPVEGYSTQNQSVDAQTNSTNTIIKSKIPVSKTSIEPVVPNNGEKIDKSSQENKQLKNDISKPATGPVTVINNTTQRKANPPSSSSPAEVKESDDDALYYIKQKKGKL